MLINAGVLVGPLVFDQVVDVKVLLTVEKQKEKEAEKAAKRAENEERYARLAAMEAAGTLPLQYQKPREAPNEDFEEED